jgi:hypothetical protein
MASKSDYTSRDYDSLQSELTDIVKSRITGWVPSGPTDFTVGLIDAFAYLGDNLSYYIDRALNEANISTATQKSTLLNFADVVGYRVSGPLPAYILLTFTNNSTSTVSIPAGTQVSAPVFSGSYTTAYFETISTVSSLAAGASTSVYAVEGETKSGGIDENGYLTPLLLGNAPTYAYQEYKLKDNAVLNDSIHVYVGQGSAITEWNYISNLYQASSEDSVFTTRMDQDGYTYIIFGDGISGSVPTDVVSAIYKTSIGSAGNITAGTTTVNATPSYIPGTAQSGLQNYGLTVTNSEDAIGGSDGDSLASLRTNIINTLQVRNQAVTLTDYSSIALTVYGVGRAFAAASSPSAVTLYLQPYNDFSGTPGLSGGVATSSWTAIQSAVNQTLSSRCPVNTTLTIAPPTYVDLYLGVTLTIDTRYKARDVKISVAQTLLDSYIGLFSYNSYGFGDDVKQVDVISRLMTIQGVLNVTITQLNRDGTAAGSSGAVGDVTINSGEIPVLKSANLSILSTGGF